MDWVEFQNASVARANEEHLVISTTHIKSTLLFFKKHKIETLGHMHLLGELNLRNVSYVLNLQVLPGPMDRDGVVVPPSQQFVRTRIISSHLINPSIYITFKSFFQRM